MNTHRHAFSMVEVVLALAIMAFCVIALVGVFSIGINTGRESAEELQAANIAQALLATRRALPEVPGDKLNNCPLPATTVSGSRDDLQLTASGEIPASPADLARYRLAYRITVPPQTGAAPPPPVSVWLRFSWPAQVPASQAKGTYELTTYLPQP